MSISETKIQEIARALANDGRFAAAYLFGSVSRNEDRPESDVDIALLPLPDYSLSQLDRLKLNNIFEEICGRKVDIGILTSNNLIYTKEAVLKGNLIYCQDKAFCDLFVATVLGLYAQFRTERKEVEDAYLAR